MPLLKIDFTLMEQVITNLLVNAAYYTPAGSSIAIGVRATDREAIITIGDTGRGVPVSIGDRVFEKFYRAPGTEAGGTGLGLSIARGFVEAHHGTIAVGTWEGGGAEFTIRLPLETSRTEGTE
jgi:two-component system sensor histidine kinase KdpD